MNYHAIEVLAFERHRSLLAEAERERRARLFRRPSPGGVLPKLRWRRLFLTASGCIGPQQA